MNLKDELQKVITDLETLQEFSNRSQLWSSVENTPWAKALQPRPLLAQMARLKSIQYKLNIQTPKGKRGLQTNKISLPIINTQDNIKPPIQAIQTIQEKKRKRGSLKLAIKLKCLDCCCGQKKEIRLCPITKCALYPYRPYKPK